MKKKILIVAESIDVEDSSGSKGRVALIENLHNTGLEVVVYHYTRKEINLEGIKCIAIKENRKSLLFYLSRIQRKIQHGFNLNLAKYLEPKFGFSFTYFNDSRSIVKSLKSFKDFDPDIVLTLSKGASFRPHHALLKLPEFHSKWLAYIHDPYPFHFYPEPYNWSEPGYEQKIAFFKELASKCRWAGFPSLMLAEWMEEKFPAFQGKSIIVPHQISKTDSEKENKSNYLDPHKFTILHAGNLLKQRPPFGFINGFNHFLEQNPGAKDQARLVFLGSGSYHREEINKFRKEIPQLVVSDGYVPYEEVKLLQKNVDVNVILESKAELSPFLPGKFPHCVEANKPILLLGPSESESRRLLGRDYPYWAENDDSNKITELIENLYQKWINDRSSLQLNRRDLEDYLSYQHLAEIFNNLET